MLPTMIYRPGNQVQVVKPMENIGVYRDKALLWFRVVWIEPLPSGNNGQVDFGAPGASATLAARQMTELRAQDGELNQWRMEILDDIAVAYNQPRAIARGITRDFAPRRFDLFSQIRDPDGQTTELYVFQDDDVWMTVTNRVAVAITMARVRFWGFRYILQPLSVQPDKWTFIPAWGYAGAASLPLETPVQQAARLLNVDARAVEQFVTVRRQQQETLRQAQAPGR